MTLQTSRLGLAALLAFAVTGIAVFLVLAARFGGPSVAPGDRFEVTAEVADAQGLVVRSDVLVRGVRAGRVTALRRTAAATTLMTFSVDEPHVRPRRGATVRVGAKTLLGEAYLDLDPGGRRAPPLREGARIRSLPAVEIDEALNAFGTRARADLQGALRETAAGLRREEAAAGLNASAGELPRLTGALVALGDALRGQRDVLAGAIDGSRSVLTELAARDEAITGLVTDGRATLQATADTESALGATLDELPRLERSARTTLAGARPLLERARPVARRLSDASPPLKAALDDLPPAARDLRRALDGAPALERAAAPLLREVDRTLPVLRPVARRLEPALANLVPMLRYLEPRRRTIAAWFANTADLGLNGDAKGKWARFFIFIDPSTALGTRSGLPTNAYPAPDDAAANRPFAEFPRLTPYRP